MRQIVLDTETTGLETSQGHRILEIGCVELVERKLTGYHYHQYINPGREVEAGALEVHGITNDFLSEKPLFIDIVDDFLDYVKGAELIIHNAPFDVGFLNHELSLAGSKYGCLADYCTVLDTLDMARKKHPGQKNGLDALCKRYFVDNSQRDLHGALLDSELLADVYLLMTGGQASLSLMEEQDKVDGDTEAHSQIKRSSEPLLVIKATADELSAHDERLAALAEKSDLIWPR